MGWPGWRLAGVSHWVQLPREVEMMRFGFRNSLLVLVLSLGAPVSAGEVPLPSLLSYVDDVAVTAKIGLLRDTPLREGEQELRFWTGFGVVVPQRMVRIRVTPTGTVSGDIYLYHSTDLRFDSDQREAAFQRWQMGSCGEQLVGAQKVVCEARINGRPRWLATYQRLLELGVLDLPDESELPEPTLDMLDGWSMVVEVRRGDQYRAYQYSNPGVIPAPEVRLAEQIGDEIGRLARRALNN